MASDLIIPSTLMTPLQAVNILIGSLGEAPIQSIDPPPTSEAEDALNRLNEADLEVQGREWKWNTEPAFPLTLGTDGTVTLPDQTLRVAAEYGSAAFGAESVNWVQRGNRLYNQDNHSYIFKVAPKVDITVRLSFEDLPQVARTYITYLAAQRFQAQKQGNQTVLQVNGADIRMALAALEQHEDKITRQSSTNGNVGVLSALYGVGGLRRNRGGL